MTAKVLVVEDEANLRDAIAYNLELEGYQVLTASDGVEGLAKARNQMPDLIVLDIMLPLISGLDVCRSIRKESDVSVIMLTAKGEEVDKVVGLEIGADDYVTKPFSMRELMARVRALHRRSSQIQYASTTEEEILISGELKVNVSSHTVTLSGMKIPCRPREFELLAHLMRSKGRAFTRRQLLNTLWENDYVGDERTVDVHIRWLREKIEEDSSKPKKIITIRGYGYRLDE